MDGGAGPVRGGSQREEKRSYRDSKMDAEELDEPDSDFEECSTKMLHETPWQSATDPTLRITAEADGLLRRKRKHSGNGGAEAGLYGAESSGFLPAYSLCMPQNRWEEIGGEEDTRDKLVHSCCCTAGDSIVQAGPSTMIEYWVYTENQHSIADCPLTRTITPPATPVSPRPCLVHVPTASAVSSAVHPAVSSPMTDTCSPISSMCSPTSSAWDTLGSTSSPGCSDQDPVSAAAHLHLLGESMSLIGHHLQKTNKLVNVSSSLSLLLDSLLCALAPLICLTAQIPELRSCTQHTLASTLENICYMMPGM